MKTKSKKSKNSMSLIILLVIVAFSLVLVVLLANKLNQTKISTKSSAAPIRLNCKKAGGVCMSLRKCKRGNGVVMGDYICPGVNICCNFNPPTLIPTIEPTNTPIPSPTPISGKRIFLTSSYYNANLGGLVGADEKCQMHANNAGLGGVWKAWLSDRITSAASRLNHYSGAYIRTDGVLIANSWADLTKGTIQNPISVDENKVPYYASTFYAKVWTNTKPDGSIYSTTMTCNNWTSGSYTAGNAVGGVFMNTDGQWSADGSDPCSVTNTNRLYCIEQ